MTAKPYIKKGWTIEVRSFENDGDSEYNAKLTVAERDEVIAFVALIELFDDGQIGNLYEPEKDEVAYVSEHFKKWALAHPTAYERLTNATISANSDLEEVHDWVMELAGRIGLAGHSEFYTRYPSSWKIFYSPEDIFINEVTAEFRV